MERETLTAVILAAGRSSRMGSPKALLLDRAGCPFVARLARTLGEAGLDEVLVVTAAPLADRVGAALAPRPGLPATRLLINEAPERGQLSSLWLGIDAMPAGASGLLVALVDAPFVAADTVRAIVRVHGETRAPIVRPARGGRHGHPVLFDRRVCAELRAADPAVGAKPVVRGYGSAIRHVEVADAGAFTDVDTPDDYRLAMERWQER